MRTTLLMATLFCSVFSACSADNTILKTDLKRWNELQAQTSNDASLERAWLYQRMPTDRQHPDNEEKLRAQGAAPSREPDACAGTLVRRFRRARAVSRLPSATEGSGGSPNSTRLRANCEANRAACFRQGGDDCIGTYRAYQTSCGN